MWLLPSRARPGNLARFFAAFDKTGGSTPGIVIVDREDWAAHQEAYETIAPPLGWAWRITEGVTQGEKLAEIWPEIIGAAWLGLVGDDCVPETPGWDRMMVGALDGANLVSCNDGWQAPKRVGNCWIMAGDLVRTVGYIFPPGLQHLFVDDVWETIGQAAQCWRVLMQVKVAHRHVLKGEAPPDDTHRRVYGSNTSNALGGLWPGDSDAYHRWQDIDAERAISAVIALREQRGFSQTTVDAHQAAEIERQVQARLRTRSVLICTPTHGNPAMKFCESMVETALTFNKLGIDFNLLTVEGSSNLPRARNTLAAWFLGTRQYTDLLFIDDDMVWSAMAAVRLIASDKGIIGAVGRKKHDAVEYCCRLLPDAIAAGGSSLEGPMSSLEVECVGTGFLKISREALETFAAKRPDLQMDPRVGDMPDDIKGHYHRFFAFGQNEEGEDYTFCLRWRELGGQVWIDPSISLGHIGSKNYEGAFMDALTVVPQPLAEAA